MESLNHGRPCTLLSLKNASKGKGALWEVSNLSVRLAVSTINLCPNQFKLLVRQFAPAHLQARLKFVDIYCAAAVGVEPAEYDARVDG